MKKKLSLYSKAMQKRGVPPLQLLPLHKKNSLDR